ncbi:MAG: hypothetical protein IPI22_01170 [Bacteroidetes bacterium]|nr:hypothetical protein [Bacteroidota bacterium]
MTNNLKYIIIPALAGIMFASCNNTPQGPTQAELDAKVEAKVKEETDKMKANCDAQIMQAAQLKKDSILVKMGKMKAPAPTPKSTTTKTTTTKTTTTKTEPVKTEPVKVEPKGLKQLSDQNKKGEGKQGGLKGLSDQSKTKENESKEIQKVD